MRSKSPKATSKEKIDTKEAEKDLFKIFYKKIINFINKNKEEFELVYFCEDEFYFMIVKKTKLFVKDINLNNPFQPYECMYNREYPILSIVCINYPKNKLSTAYKDPIFIENVLKFGAKILRLNLKDNVEEKLKNFFSE